ncbi:MAG: TonB-dependent receptor [Candidatus Eremiobacteraeota bacterium]|nr:TonB-dependent receptor [Candidatus Eremiobacteraeota bacterium]MBC5822459.1 TonB-dependent receptor [Candidatus Eremiobacteraeota bacterium]
MPPPSPSTTTLPEPSSSQSPAGVLRQIGRVVTSDRRNEPAGETSRTTFVVDRARIEAYGARTVADALQDVPGVQLYRNGAFGQQVNYGIRGSTSAQTLLLVDGQPVADPTTGGAYLENLSTVGVNRIEIVESGASTLYGTSAIGGVINVITSVPRRAYLEAADGSFADRDLRVAAGNGRIGASFERHVATDAYGYPGFTYGRGTCVFVQPCAFAGGSRVNGYGDQSAGRVSLDVPVGGGFVVRAHADDAALSIGVPGQLTFLTPQTTQRFSNATGLFEVERRTRASSLTLDVSGVNGRFTFGDPSFGEYDTFFGRAQLSLKEAATFGRDDLVAGIDLGRQSGVFTAPSSTSSGSGSTPATITPPSATGASESQVAAYVQFGTAPFAGARITAGLRGENDAPHGTVFAPSLGGVMHAGALRFAGNVGESFRVPTIQDLYYPVDSNPGLQPEKAAVADATVDYEGRSGTLSVGWFARGGSNFIVVDPLTFIPYNAQRAQTAGIAVTAQSKPFAGVIADLSFTDLYKALNLSTGARLPQNPVGQATLGLMRPFGRDRYSYGLRWRIVGSDGNDATYVPRPLTATYDAYDSFDAFVRYKLAPQTVLTVRGFNLGDEHAAPIFGYPLPGRRLFVELSTR